MTGTFDVFDIKLSNMSSSSGSMLLSCLLYVGTCIFEVSTSGCTFVLVNFLTLVYGFGLMGYFFAAYYKKAFGKYLNPEENS